MVLYLRYCRTGVLFHITVHVKDQDVTTYDDVILVKPNRIYDSLLVAHERRPLYCITRHWQWSTRTPRVILYDLSFINRYMIYEKASPVRMRILSPRQ